MLDQPALILILAWNRSIASVSVNIPLVSGTERKRQNIVHPQTEITTVRYLHVLPTNYANCPPRIPDSNTPNFQSMYDAARVIYAKHPRCLLSRPPSPPFSLCPVEANMAN